MTDTLVPVFDLGGVFVDWNPMYLFRKLFETEEDAQWFHEAVCTLDWNLEFDAGEIYSEGVAKLITMDRKIQSVTGAVGDLVSRADTTLTAATLTDYFKAASGILTPYPTTDLIQVVTQVEVKTDGTTRTDWSRQYANGVLTTLPNTARKIPPEMVNISKGKYIIVSESRMSYLPLYGIVFKTAIPLYRENYYIPRFGGTITVN